MTQHQLQTIEAELQRRGYKKWTCSLTSTESYAWFKTFAKERNEHGEVIPGYQVAFRVWDYTKYGETDQNAYGFDFWTSAIGTDSRMDFTSNWEPICDFDTFEKMARDFNELVKKYVNDKNR